MTRGFDEALSKIDRAGQKIDPSGEPAANDELGLQSYEKELSGFDDRSTYQMSTDFKGKVIELDLLENEMKMKREDYSERTDIELRKSYADNILVLVTASMGATYFFLAKVASGHWHLSDDILKSVVLALVVEVISLVLIVTNYLFKNVSKKKGTNHTADGTIDKASHKSRKYTL